ncbi:MAG: tripartite tricarboxylate transporter substrate binding protein [SAR324 cluster bacterium]|nr:tripartite tricarboxylate transporter substrate binding protein [SAR324 cluster bacterium]
MSSRFKKTLSAILFASITAISLFTTANAKPSGVECIAPAGAGGGWDFTCRVPAAQVMGQLGLIDGTMKVTNMSGAGGGKAFSHVVAKRSDDQNLIVAASMATAARLGQNVYAGFTAADVRWVGALGADYGAIAVHRDSKFKTLGDLVEAMRNDPRRTAIVGGSSAGGWDHLKMLILADKAGIKDLKAINYISFDNGGTAMLEVISKRADAFTGDISELVDYFKKGDIRILAILAPERIGALDGVQTAKEQGFDVIGANWRGFYAPKNVSQARYNEWVDIVRKVAESSQWSDLAAKNGLAPFASFGGDFETFVGGQIDLVGKISKDLGFMK